MMNSLENDLTFFFFFFCKWGFVLGIKVSDMKIDAKRQLNVCRGWLFFSSKFFLCVCVMYTNKTKALEQVTRGGKDVQTKRHFLSKLALNNLETIPLNGGNHFVEKSIVKSIISN